MIPDFCANQEINVQDSVRALSNDLMPFRIGAMLVKFRRETAERGLCVISLGLGTKQKHGCSKIILNLVFDALGFEDIIKPASGILVVGWFGFSGSMTNFSAIFFSVTFFGPLFPWLIQISYFGVVTHCVKSSEFRRKFAALYRVFRHLNRGDV
ncbi:MAG: hypothetical protein B7Z82_00010 [Halothiobacillus sp. 20-54-6]|nr:MAG: hypothetical protein B7Z82_00010 [Halothiobacillus sp. 20-54-6]